MNHQIDFTQIDDTSGRPSYNTGLGAVFALRDLLNNYHNAISLRHYDASYSILYSVYVELSPRMTEDEKEKHRRIKERIEKSLTIYGKNQKNYMRFNLLNILNEWAELLMQTIHDKKLGIVDSAGMASASKVD